MRTMTDLLSHFSDEERDEVLKSLPAKYLWKYVMEVKARKVERAVQEFREARAMYLHCTSNLCLVKPGPSPKPAVSPEEPPN